MSETRKITLAAGHFIETAISGIKEGNMDARFDDASADSSRNKAVFYGHMGLQAADVIRMSAEHGEKIVDVASIATNSNSSEDTSVICDGLITTEFNRGLALFPADCVPMFAYSKHQPVLGLIHVGREGAGLGIHTKAIQKLVDEYNVELDGLRVYLGPSIKKESYSYPELAPSLRENEQWDDYISYSKEEKMYRIDLAGFVHAGLIAAGVHADHIDISATDTAADEIYFSNLRSNVNGSVKGRNGILAVIRRK